MNRNANLGPDARFFKLQPEEEDLVEKLLMVCREPDTSLPIRYREPSSCLSCLPSRLRKRSQRKTRQQPGST